MDLKLMLLALLPLYANARINVEVRASLDPNRARVEYYGSNVDLISDKERDTFKINDGQLKSACQKYQGGYPTDAYVRSPTPWGDLYRSYGWDQVQRTLNPISAKVLRVKTEPVIVMKQDFYNNSTVKATYNAAITQTVEETVSSSWSKGGDLTVGQEISYGVNFEVFEVSGTTSLSYTSSWGEETSKSKTVSVGSSSGVTVDLEPGQAIQATLSATRGYMEIEVEYSASLDGDAAVNFSKTYKGHHFWRYDINSVLSAAGLPRSYKSTEVIKIGFYSDAKVSIADKTSRALLKTANVNIFR